MIDINDLKLQAMVRSSAFKIKKLPMEREDVEQELYYSILCYFKEVPEEKRSMGAIRNVINQKLFKIIRQNITFEGCSTKSRSIRKELNMPQSLSQPLTNSEDNSDWGKTNLLSIFKQNPDFTCSDELAVNDSVINFKEVLTDKEKPIFVYMCMGINKPRFVCEKLYGKNSVNQKRCKTISKHMINIKNKFIEYWRNEHGKLISRRNS